MTSYPKNIILLLSLNDDECKKFKEYLSSPFFNKTKKLLPLYELIVKDFKKHKKIYCETDFIKKAGLKTSLYKSHLQEFPLDLYQFQNEYQIEELLDTHIKNNEEKRKCEANLQVLSDAIDRDFILKKLCCTVLMLNRSNITEAKYKFGLAQLALKSLKENASFDKPLIKFFYYAYEILVGERKENAFQQLNKELLRSNQKIAKDMVNVLFSILQNNLKLLKSVKIQLHQQLFNLYDIMLTKGYIQDNEKISVSFYKNVASIGLELGKFDYVEKFIEEYKNKLIKSELVGDVYAYNKAKLYIYKGELKNADQLIKNLHFKDALYKFALKCLEIMLFYEIKQFGLLESKINAFEVALSPKRPPYISETNTKVYRNFIQCMRKLYRFNFNPDITKNDVQQLVYFINDTNQIANRKWVLTKAETLLADMN